MHTLKKFVKYYAPYRTVFFLDLICAAIISLVDLAFPQILRSLTKTLFTEDPSQILGALLPIGLALLVLYIIQTFCKYYVSYQGHMMGAHMERDMRQKLFDHYERLSFSYYDQNNSGQMMSKLVSDLFDISDLSPVVQKSLLHLTVLLIRKDQHKYNHHKQRNRQSPVNKKQKCKRTNDFNYGYK